MTSVVGLLGMVGFMIAAWSCQPPPTVRSLFGDGDTLYFRFVHRNDAKKARGWRGRESDWDSVPKGVSVFLALDSIEFQAMAVAHAQGQGWNPTDVAAVPVQVADSFVVFTADPLDSNGTWTDAGRAKHGVLNGIGADTTFALFPDSILATRADTVFRGNRN